jgi:DNA-binding NtrC family response regulator
LNLSRGLMVRFLRIETNIRDSGRSQTISHNRKRPRIFVVDDESVIAFTLAQILGFEGFDSKSFQDPREALQSARIEPPDLLISDVVMPGMSGIDLALEFQRHCPDCRILLFSGNIHISQLVDKAAEAGHRFTVLTKPVPPAELLRKVRATLSESPTQALGPA